MDHSEFKRLAYKRSRMHNKGDLKAYAQPTAKDATKKVIDSNTIEKQTKEFVRKGGIIKHIPKGVTAYEEGKKPAKAFVIRAKSNVNAT